MTTRSNYRSWDPSYETAPIPTSCNSVAALTFGYTCATKSPGIPAIPQASCFPWGTPTTISSDYTFYSPATACPSGYNYERSRTRTTPLSIPSTAAIEDQWIDGETAVYCCPDGYAWSDITGHCRLQYGGVYVNVNCTNSEEVETKTLSLLGDSVRAVAPVLQVRFRESDGTFVPPKSTEAMTTPVGRPTPSDVAEGTADESPVETSTSGIGEATQTAAKPGNAERRFGKVKTAIVLVPLFVVGVLFQ